MRQRKQGNVERSNRSQIIDTVSISKRPAEIEDHESGSYNRKIPICDNQKIPTIDIG